MEDGDLHSEAAAAVSQVRGELQHSGPAAGQLERTGQADVARPDELRAPHHVPPPGEHHADHVTALTDAALLAGVRLEQHLDGPQVGLPAQQRGVDGVHQQGSPTGVGYLAA